ncbi:helix-turn-helix domain-containing protein [Leucobacter sp. BZR 635]
MYSESLLPNGAALWRSQGSAGGAVIPADGSVDLIVRDDRVFVAGPSTMRIVSERDGEGGSLGLRIPPGHAAQLFGPALPEIADQLVPFSDLAHDPGAGQLRDAMLRWGRGGTSPTSLAQAASVLAAAHAAHNAWADAVRRAAGGLVPAGSAAEQFGASERSFRRRMLGVFGYGYATLVRIERASRARALLEGGSSLSDAAATAGFSDQPHLSREFQRLVGMSPGQFAASSA